MDNIKLNVEIARSKDGFWQASVYHESGALLDETQIQGPGYDEICAEVGVCIRAEITRQRENESRELAEPDYSGRIPTAQGFTLEH